MSEFIPPATRFVDLPEKFLLKRGGVLNGSRIAYETLGELNPARDNVILILTGLSTDAHIATQESDPSVGWWEGMVGPNKPINTDCWHVLCINSLGSCKGSTGPASINPLTDDAYRTTFPDLSIEDIADAGAYVVKALGIKQIACLIGVSMGAMSALSMLSRHPGLVRNHISISGAAYSLPFSLALRSLQRESICQDPKWDSGNYSGDSYPTTGMLVARKLGIVTYRSAEEWRERFGKQRILNEPTIGPTPFGIEFHIQSYLEKQAQKFCRTFDPNCYLYLSRAIDWFEFGEDRHGCVEDALAEIDLNKALVIGVESDILFPLSQQIEIAEGLKKGETIVEFISLDSQQGHDAFLVDIVRFGNAISHFLYSLISKDKIVA